MLLQNVLPSRCKVGISWTPSVPVSDNGFQVVLWNFEWWPRWAWEKHGATSAVQRPTSIHCPNILGGLACDYCNNAILLPIETPCKGHATKGEKNSWSHQIHWLTMAFSELKMKRFSVVHCFNFQWRGKFKLQSSLQVKWTNLQCPAMSRSESLIHWHRSCLPLS